MKLNLHIEHIVLDGVELSPAETRRMAHALERELLSRMNGEAARGEASPPWSGAAVASLAAAPITVDPGAGGTRIGRELARSVHRGLGPVLPEAASVAPRGGDRS
ncbi:hypothetical protein LVJ94_24790 [Pendulispora rubella]|uniref:Uncharacterized protein n=1 Tax=Pendulispora rubella TaxID=2741070 RepID=A0ABZ2LHL1_9BACT